MGSKDLARRGGGVFGAAFLFSAFGCAGSASHHEPPPDIGVQASSLTSLSSSGWVASASLTSGADVPAHAIDSNPATRWTSGADQASGQWFQIDLQSPQTFDELSLDAGNSTNSYPRSFQINVSADGMNWATAATATGTSGYVLTAFQAQTARYVQVLLTAGVAGASWSIQELGLYSTAPSDRTLLTPLHAVATSVFPGWPAQAAVDGSGLAFPTTSQMTTVTELPKHNESGTYPGPQMWMSAGLAPVSITFDLGAPQVVDTLFIWNYAEVAGVDLEHAGLNLTNRGAKDVNVYASTTNSNPSETDFVQAVQFRASCGVSAGWLVEHRRNL